jgi:antitoxin component YwqK of YwqJK toxin-antitoxin module
MECKAITNEGTQCSREAEPGSKYCWQHQNYEGKEVINTSSLSNTSDHNIVETYYPETKILQTKETYKNGILDGLVEEYYENGKLSERSNYKNGKLNGLSEHWFDNGDKYIHEYYKNDKKNGLSEEWDENGNLVESTIYENGYPIE